MWPSLQTIVYDGWVLRFADGYTKRANSITPIYESFIDTEEKIQKCEKIYRDKNLPVIYKITEKSTPAGIDDLLEKKGYKRIDEVSVMVLNIPEIIKRENGNLKIEYEPKIEWIENYFKISENNPENCNTALKMLYNIAGKTFYISKVNENVEVVGCGFGVIEREFIGIFDISVSKEFRRMGYGTDIINSLIGIAKKNGIKKAYLQVVKGNTAAENMYKNIGFEEKYTYWYRIKKY